MNPLFIGILVIIILLIIVLIVVTITYSSTAVIAQQDDSMIKIDGFHPDLLNNDIIHNNIPKIIHQTYVSDIVPIGLAEKINTWKNLNPDYIYCYYTDEQCRNFIRDHYSNEILKAYDTLSSRTTKSILFRCCVLYIYGGVYADISFKLFFPLDEIITKYDDYILVLNYRKDSLYDDLIITYPGNPVLFDAINLCIGHVSNNVLDRALIGHITVNKGQWQSNLKQKDNQDRNLRFLMANPGQISDGGIKIIETDIVE